MSKYIELTNLTGEKYITKIEGDYYNVMGVPIAKVYKELKEFNNEI